MDEREGRAYEDDAPAEERGVGDEVAGDERSGRGATGGPGRGAPRRSGRRTARTVSADEARVAGFTGEQRLLLLDSWIRSHLSATDFAGLVGVTPTTLYGWRKRFEHLAPGEPEATAEGGEHGLQSRPHSPGHDSFRKRGLSPLTTRIADSAVHDVLGDGGRSRRNLHDLVAPWVEAAKGCGPQRTRTATAMRWPHIHELVHVIQGEPGTRLPLVTRLPTLLASRALGSRRSRGSGRIRGRRLGGVARGEVESRLELADLLLLLQDDQSKRGQLPPHHPAATAFALLAHNPAIGSWRLIPEGGERLRSG
jgi:hypothetical protein